MTAFAGYKGAVYITSSPSLSFTNLAMTDAGDHQNYTITLATRRYWDNTGGAFVIQNSPDGTTGWATVSPSTYTIQYVGGKVVFNAPLVNTFVRANAGFYFPYSQLGDGQNWELGLDLNVVDVTTFGSAWKLNFPLLRGAAAKFGKLYNDGTFLGLLNALMVVVLFVDGTSAPAGPRYEGYAYIKQDQIKSDVKAVIMEDVSFAVVDKVFYLAN